MNDALKKAHRARRVKADAEIWPRVQASMELNNCKCDLRPGMTRDELPQGVGCTMGSRYICPALDTYRRLLPPNPLPEDERLLQESA